MTTRKMTKNKQIINEMVIALYDITRINLQENVVFDTTLQKNEKHKETNTLQNLET